MQHTPINNSREPVKRPPESHKAIPGKEHIQSADEAVEKKGRTHVKRIKSSVFAKGWIAIVAAAVFAYSGYLVYNLYRTTVTDYDKYARAAANEQWTLMTYSAKRGMIYDSNGTPLASNTYDFTVICSPKMITSTEISREEIMQNAVAILGVDYEKLDKIIPVDPTDKTDPRNDVAGCDVIKNVPQETKDQFDKFLKDNKVKGFGFVAVPQRYYNYGSLASQVVGYAKNDGVSLNGLYGLEAYYNDVLSGEDGYRYSETDEITGGVLPYSDATTIPVSDGNNVVTNIDISIQRIAEDAAKDAYEKYDPIDGVCAIVMNPYTGAIYAMVSLPNYDCNDPYGKPYGVGQEAWNYMSADDKVQYVMKNAWRNRCVSDTYEPGSTFKSLTTCMAFEENLTNEEEIFSDAPIAISSKHTISCWAQKSYGNHGTEPLRKAFENSCNPVFTQLAYRIGLSKYYSYVRMLGFYEPTGIDLPAEGKGIFHKEPTTVDMAVLAYGESSTVTPIQLITSYCAIINGGNLLVPHIAKYITDPDGNIVDEIEPEVVRTVFSENTCKRVRTLMEGVVNDGTGSAGKVDGYAVAGKTSTSTIDVGELKGAHVLSFSCYAPSYDPKIAVLVVINKPRDNSVGSSAAASTAARIVEETLSYMGVQRRFSAAEYEKLTQKYYVQEVEGYTAARASSAISKVGGHTTVYGTLDMNSETIIGSTYPDIYHDLYKNSIVILYPAGITKEQMLTTRVPNLIGMSALECIDALRKVNLNCDFGDSESQITGVCVAQSSASGSTVFAGEIIKVTLSTVAVNTEQTEETAVSTGGEYDEDGRMDALPPEGRRDEDG